MAGLPCLALPWKILCSLIQTSLSLLLVFSYPPPHQGRTADGGHYMGWVRQAGDNWLVFDDEDVSECKTAEVLQLSGGGDWHMAYMCFYRFKGAAAATNGDGAK